MSEDQDDSQKTEDPSQKRLEDALKRGQVVFSREVVSFFLLMALALEIAWVIPGIVHDARGGLQPFLERPESFPLDRNATGQLLLHALGIFLKLLILPLLVMVVAVVAASMIQKPITFTLESTKPQWSRVSPGAGAKRLFSSRSVTEFLKGLMKIGIVGAIMFSILKSEGARLPGLTDISAMSFLGILGKAAQRIVIASCAAMFFIAVLDYLYQRFQYLKGLRMSKQDLKDEYKQQEGDPHVKQRLRALRRERARTRMMAAVPTSDVVITNPTHFAVALKYDPGSMDAPKVVAKGADKVAARIREKAEEHKVPILRNPPLARALFDSVEIDEPIKMEHYKAVAEVIGYVYRMKGKTMPQRGAKPGARTPPGGPKRPA